MPKKNFFNLIKSYSNYFVITLTLFICLVSFQNCTNQFENTDSSTISSQAEHGTPFAFDISVDHLALMTCPTSQESDANGGYTIKWGSYNNGLSFQQTGLSFTDNWLSQNANNVPAAMLNIINASQKHSNLNIVSGYFRSGSLLLGNLTTNPVGSQSGNYMVSDYTKLPIDSFTHQLVEKPQQSHFYFPRVPVTANSVSNTIEGQLYRPTITSPNTAGDDFTFVTRSYEESNRSLLHIGLAQKSKLNSNKIYLMSSQGDYKDTEAIGSSYKFTYGTIGGHDRYLAAVAERDLNGDLTTNGNWQCPSSLRFMVVARKDIADGTTFTPIDHNEIAQNKVLQSVTNVIDPAYWDIDIINKRIARKSASVNSLCYDKQFYKLVDPSTNESYSYNELAVDYSLQRCGSYPSNREDYFVNEERRLRHYVCPHFVSICVK